MRWSARLMVWFVLGVLPLGGTRAPMSSDQVVPPASPSDPPLEQVAAFPGRRATGVAVSEAGRTFVCFPYWTDQYQGGLAEVKEDGSLQPYPNREWNAWRRDSSQDPGEHFVSIQSIVADGNGNLWVLDTGAPRMQGPLPKSAKLVRINLETNEVARVIRFDSRVVPPGSYLSDVRFDKRGWAYLVDSGRGAIVVVNLADGSIHRLLQNHPSTHAESVPPVIGEEPLRSRQGRFPPIHATGIALSHDGRWLYYHALYGYHLYRVPTRVLRRLHGQPGLVAAAVEDLGPDVISDGMVMGPEGNLYLSSLEHNAIVRRTPEGDLKTLTRDEKLCWPDTLAFGPDGSLYVTTSRIHRMKRFGGETDHNHEPFALWRLPHVSSSEQGKCLTAEK